MHRYFAFDTEPRRPPIHSPGVVKRLTAMLTYFDYEEVRGGVGGGGGDVLCAKE